MTEQDLLYAMRHVSSRYTDEARERAEKAAEKKRSRIVRRTALAAVGAAACFGLVLFGLSHIPEQNLNVAESDAEVEVTQIAETSAAETSGTLPAGTESGDRPAKTVLAANGTAPQQNNQTAAAKETGTAAVTAEQTAKPAAGQTAAAVTGKTTVVSAAAAKTTAPASAQAVMPDRLTYELVPRGKTGWLSAYENGLANHVYRAEPGEDLWLDLRVRNDPGTYSCFLTFELGELELLEWENGDIFPELTVRDYVKEPLFFPDDYPKYDRYELVEPERHYVTCNAMNRRSENTYAADGSVLCSLHVKVPEGSGRYPLTLTQKPMIFNWYLNYIPYANEVCRISPFLYLSQTKLQSFTFVGTDILVGDEPVPGKAEPLGTETLYRESFYADDPEKRREIMQLGILRAEGNAGDDHVPVQLFVLNNDGFGSLYLQIRHGIELTACEDGNGIIFEPAEAFSDMTCTASATTDGVWSFRLERGSNADLNAEGCLGTFYVKIPEDTVSGRFWELETDVQRAQYPDGRPLTYYESENAELQVIFGRWYEDEETEE